MKICQISNWYFPYAQGGAGIYVNNITKALVNLRHEVSVITMLPKYSGVNSLTPKLEIENGVKLYRFHPMLETRLRINLLNKKTVVPFWYLTEFYNPHSDYVIKRILKREKPDVVHVNYTRGFSFSVMRVVKDLHLPLVYTCHDYRLLCPLGSLLHRSGKICKNPKVPCKIYRYINARIADSRPDIVIAPSQFLLDIHTTQKSFKESKKTLLPYGIELGNFNNVKRDIHIKKLNILYVGSLVKLKGVQILIEALKKISHKNLKLSIIGDGNYASKLKEFAKGDDRIIFYGKLSNEEVQSFYKIADIVVVPSICYEVLGIVILEAFRAGTPVIGSNIGGIPEVIRDKYNGFLFEAGHVEQLKKILENVIENSEQLEELQKNALKSIKRHNMSTHIEKLIEIYREAIDLSNLKDN